jgi:hypothetical protein
MPKKRTGSSVVVPDRCFVRELAGETPPSFSTMEMLYGSASELYGLRPWRLIDESQLILVRDSASGEICYCSVMGMLGEVYSIHAYIGTETFLNLIIVGSASYQGATYMDSSRFCGTSCHVMAPQSHPLVLAGIMST